MIAVRELTYVVAGAKDLAAWEKFATLGMGLEVYAHDAQRLYLRSDMNAYRLCLERAESEDLIALGWMVETEADFDALVAHVKSLGNEVQLGTRAQADRRRVLKLASVRDPNGILNEIVWGAEIKEQRPFRSPIQIDGFVSPENGFGHVVLSVDNVHESADFYKLALGLKHATVMRIGETVAYFMRCNCRHHSVAIAESHRQKRLHHIEFEYKTFDDIGRAMDRAAELDIPIVCGLGRHVGDRVTSFYLRSPSGMVMEMGYGSRVIADDQPVEFEVFSGSIWGHRSGMENC